MSRNMDWVPNCNSLKLAACSQHDMDGATSTPSTAAHTHLMCVGYKNISWTCANTLMAAAVTASVAEVDNASTTAPTIF